MPDKWEYPWYAAWDLAFHCIPLAEVDPRPDLGRIAVPTLVLHSRDDPLIPAHLFESLDRTDSVTLHLTEHGGHLGSNLGAVELTRRDYLARLQAAVSAPQLTL